MAAAMKCSSLFLSSLHHTSKASSRLLVTSPRPITNTFSSQFMHQQRATMASRTEAGEAISQVAQAEGGTTKGSVSAQMQSELDRATNAQQGTQGIQNNSTGGKSAAGQAISEVAHEEGGTAKGSQSAQMQSELTKQMNAQQGTQNIQNNSTGGKSAAGQAISEVAHQEGGTAKGSQSAQMQSELTRQMNAQQGNSQGNQQRTSKSPAAQAISEVARAEGGTAKGSQSAQMQSELAKQRNAQQGNSQGSQQGTSKSPAGQAISEVARAEGGTTKGSQSAQMQSELTKQMNAQQGIGGGANSISSGGASFASNINATGNSLNGANAREANFQEAAEAIAPKIQDGTVTKEEANLLHSRENRAHRHTEKGGIASQAQQVVTEKEKGGL